MNNATPSFPSFSYLVAVPFLVPVLLLVLLLWISGCSGSDSATVIPDQLPNQFDDNEASQTEAGVSDEESAGSQNTDQSSISPSTTESETPAGTNSGPMVPDPAVQNTTRVSFEITVPAYQSNALQVSLVWGEQSFLANWVGDELWFTDAEFPTATEHLLSVVFSDGNGAVTLGRFETPFKTGINAAEIYKIPADRFDTDSADDDGDGFSNLQELIAGTDPFELPRILLFSETRAYRHDSIDEALLALEDIAASDSMLTERANDSDNVFTDANLARYDAIVWVLTSGDVLNVEEQEVFERYIQSGGGYAGIHAASDTEYQWPWYGALVGAYFDRHPPIQQASQRVENNTHPSTRHLPSIWTRTDEWYDYRSNPRAQVNVLLSLDENSYTGGVMGEDHPSAWYHDFDGGRSWYTGGGHTSESYAEDDFRLHLLGGLQYAVGKASTD